MELDRFVEDVLDAWIISSAATRIQSLILISSPENAFCKAYSITILIADGISKVGESYLQGVGIWV